MCLRNAELSFYQVRRIEVKPVSPRYQNNLVYHSIPSLNSCSRARHGEDYLDCLCLLGRGHEGTKLGSGSLSGKTSQAAGTLECPGEQTSCTENFDQMTIKVTLASLRYALQGPYGVTRALRQSRAYLLCRESRALFASLLR